MNLHAIIRQVRRPFPHVCELTPDLRDDLVAAQNDGNPMGYLRERWDEIVENGRIIPLARWTHCLDDDCAYEFVIHTYEYHHDPHEEFNEDGLSDDESYEWYLDSGHCVTQRGVLVLPT